MIQCARSNQAANYGPGLFHVKSGSRWGVDGRNRGKTTTSRVLSLNGRQWWEICVTEEPRVLLPLSQSPPRGSRMEEVEKQEETSA